MDIERLLSGAANSLSVRRCFGEAVEQAGTVIIPVAFVAGGGGGGEEAHREEQAGEPRQQVWRPGQGGGFGGVAWPLGVYVLREGRVRWVPAVDATRIVLGALAIARVVLKARVGRRQRADR